MSALASFSSGARAVIIAAAIAILILFVQAAASVIAPILLAVFIAIVATPPLRWLRSKGVPKYLAVGLVLFVLLDIGSLFALLITGALEGFEDGLPTYQERLTLLSLQFGAWLESIGLENSQDAILDLSNPAAATALVRSALAQVSDLFGTGLLVLLAVVFMLLEASTLREKLERAFNLDDNAKARLSRTYKSIIKYMAIKSLASLATGGLIGVWLWVLDIHFALLWAMLAVLLNFIPFVGAILMAIPAVIMALVQADLSVVLLVAAGYLVVNTAIGSFLEPRFMGRGLGISTLAVFLSLIFWGWVLGMTGVFLAVPLTMVLIIVLEASPKTRPLAILLGPAVEKSPTEDSQPKESRSSGQNP